jgi:hypothetical protein
MVFMIASQQDQVSLQIVRTPTGDASFHVEVLSSLQVMGELELPVFKSKPGKRISSCLDEPKSNVQDYPLTAPWVRPPTIWS